MKEITRSSSPNQNERRPEVKAGSVKPVIRALGRPSWRDLRRSDRTYVVLQDHSFVLVSTSRTLFLMDCHRQAAEVAGYKPQLLLPGSSEATPGGFMPPISLQTNNMTLRGWSSAFLSAVQYWRTGTICHHCHNKAEKWLTLSPGDMVSSKQRGPFRDSVAFVSLTEVMLEQVCTASGLFFILCGMVGHCLVVTFKFLCQLA